MAFDKEQLDGFREAADSLKLYQRADLRDATTGTSLIKELYVDPLPNEHILQTLLKPRTTFIHGRKGTGKSTLFQRVEYELLQDKRFATAYVDIKTVYERSLVDPALLSAFSDKGAMSPDGVRHLLLYQVFLSDVISEIKETLKRRLHSSIIARVVESFKHKQEELFSELDLLTDQSKRESFISVLGLKQLEITTSSETASTGSSKSSGKLKVSKDPEIGVEANSESSTSDKEASGVKYSDLLMRHFDLKALLAELKRLLSSIGVQHLIIFIDDFSELPADAMQIVVDSLLAPLHNWSDDLIRLKVATYPGRVYYGAIDKTKIDDVYLDMYRLYGGSDVTSMEEKAIDFTRRLVQQRIHHFCGVYFEEFTSSARTDLWRQIFYATMANPRILGYLLLYLYESVLIFDSAIGSKAIRDAADRFYVEKVHHFFVEGRFLHEDFEERSSIFSLKELLETIVTRARGLKSHRDSEVIASLTGTPPTSHFHLVKEYESLLRTLELNFFVTKYYEQRDRDGRLVVVFALNYGLCQKYALAFGRPIDRREYRLYYIERVFDYTPIFREFIKNNQEIVCDSCDCRHDYDKLEALRMFGMQCPNCRTGTCRVINLSRKYEGVLREVDENLLLPGPELGIISTLNSEGRAMVPQEVASELDYSYQLVGRRAKNLSERDLVARKSNDQGRRIYQLTEYAKKTYFGEDSSLPLNVGGDDSPVDFGDAY